MVWVKDRIGMGYYARQRHELLLIGRRGDIAVPDPEDRPDSVIEAPRLEHSAKPEEAYAAIVRMYPDLPRIELFARGARDGWAVWGNEAQVAA
jgi:N6-adenosine-specific RNA methylase IME4